MKTVTYTLLNGKKNTIEYDETAPCWYCGLPVEEASFGGTVVCGSCDCGMHRDGTKWTREDAEKMFANFRKKEKDLKPTPRRKKL